MDDVDCLGTKIISSVENNMKVDPEIDEYDILPVPVSMQNRNPVKLIDHKLGIESWGATMMYCTAAKDLKQWHKKKKKKLSESEKGWLSCRTMCALLVVPDHSTAWNIRKEMITQQLLTVKDDLCLSKLILTKHPKSSETFAHRRWLLTNLLSKSFSVEMCNLSASGDQPSLCQETVRDTTEARSSLALAMETSVVDHSCRQSNSVNSDVPSSKLSVKAVDPLRKDSSSKVSHSSEQHCLVEQELLVCHLAADKYHNNYNAWSHRTWVLQHFACCCNQFICKELKLMESFVWSHVSDHSGFQYRQFLLQSLSLSGADILDSVNSELHLTTDLITSYSGHEAVWYHRRFVLHCFKQQKSFFTKSTCKTSSGIEKDCSHDVDLHEPKRTRLDLVAQDTFVQSEREWCKNLLEGYSTNSWQQTLVNHHLHWLNHSFQEKCS